MPDVAQVAFMDNLYLVAPAPQAARAASAVGPWLKDYLLTLKPEKSHVWAPRPISPDDFQALTEAGIPPACVAPPEEGMIVLGAPLGSADFMARHASSLVEEQFAVLQDPNHLALSTQSRWLQILYAISRRVGHLARSVPPDCLQHADAVANALLAKAVAILFQLQSPLRPDTAGLLPLALRDGGLGLLPFAGPAAFLAGTLAGRHAVLAKLARDEATGATLTLSDAALQAAVTGITDPAFLAGALVLARGAIASAEAEAATLAAGAGRPSALAAAQLQAQDALPRWGPSLVPLDTLLPDLDSPLPARLQASLTRILQDRNLEVWRAGVSPDRDAARISTTGPAGNTWLASMPGKASAFSRICSWPGNTFAMAVQIYLLELPAALRAAGFQEGALRCWLHKVGLAEGTGGADGASDSEEEDAGGGSQTHFTPSRTELAGASAPPLPPPRPGRCNGPHTLAEGPTGWISLLVCKFGNYPKTVHDALARLLAFIAPSTMVTTLPGAFGRPTASHPAISRFLASAANTGRGDWNCPDVLQPVGPTDGRPLHLDVTLTTVRTGAADKNAKGAQGAADAALQAAHNRKVAHYEKDGSTLPGGPMAPGTATFRPFPLLNRGKMGKASLLTLREWSRQAARESLGGEAADAGALALRASAFLRSYYRVISTTLWRWHATRLLQAATWLSEDLSADAPPEELSPFPAWSDAPVWGDLPRHHLGLADLDEAGLALAAAALAGPRAEGED